MKIALVIPSLKNEGPVIVIKEIVKEMVRRGHQCIVYYFDSKYKEAVKMPCPTQRVGMMEDLPWEELDVIDGHNWRAVFYVCLHLRKVRKNRVRFIGTIHENMFLSMRANHGKIFTWLYTHWYIYLLKKTDLRIALSKTVIKDAYEDVFKGYPITYIYNSRTVNYDAKLSEVEKQQLLAFKGDCILLGLNARLDRVKAIDVIIDALPMLENYKLFIVGDGKERDNLQIQAQNNGVADRAFFAGYKDDAFRYLPYYDIFMMPSRSEGFPLGLTEAMAYKCNVVISDIPIFQEFFTEDEMTFSKTDDPVDLARAVKEATANPKGEKAYKKYLKCYSPQIFGDMHEKVYSGSNNPHED